MTADLIFTGATMLTGVPAGQQVSRQPEGGIAVESGRITAVGGADEIRDLAGPATRRVDLGSATLLPGFQDAHVHPVQGGLERMQCDLSTFENAPDYYAAISEYARTHRDSSWVIGAGWTMPAFPGGLPRREDLDRLVPDRPAYLPNRDHHGAWVNTVALERAGITAQTPDPPDGRIERDADGAPTGMLHEGAVDMVAELVPRTTPKQELQGLLEAQRYLQSLGITAWQDAILGSYSGLTDASETYRVAREAGSLTCKVVGALWWDRSRGAEQIEELLERRERYSVPGFRPTSVKIMQDGVVENFTAGMTVPYLDRAGFVTSNAGLSMVEPAALCDYATRLDAHGFQVHVHAIGDRAVREALDAFEAAKQANGPSANRHHIAHIQVIHPDDLPRFAELDVTANMQPLWATHEDQMDELNIPFLGPERTAWQYPFASLARNGARLAAGSDWPVSSPNPLWGIHVAVNRQVPTGAGEQRPAFLAHEALDLETAVLAYTAGSAYVNGLDDTGRIEVGMAADLVVLDRDIYACPRNEIGDARVQATYIDGVEVYSA